MVFSLQHLQTNRFFINNILHGLKFLMCSGLTNLNETNASCFALVMSYSLETGILDMSISPKYHFWVRVVEAEPEFSVVTIRHKIERLTSTI